MVSTPKQPNWKKRYSPKRILGKNVVESKVVARK